MRGCILLGENIAPDVASLLRSGSPTVEPRVWRAVEMLTGSKWSPPSSTICSRSATKAHRLSRCSAAVAPSLPRASCSQKYFQICSSSTSCCSAAVGPSHTQGILSKTQHCLLSEIQKVSCCSTAMNPSPHGAFFQHTTLLLFAFSTFAS